MGAGIGWGWRWRVSIVVDDSGFWLASATLACEVCGFDFESIYGDRGRDYIECHHRTPLHVTGTTKNKLDDLALICSNCHRMIHRTKTWLLPDQLKQIVDSRR